MHCREVLAGIAAHCVLSDQELHFMKEKICFHVVTNNFWSATRIQLGSRNIATNTGAGLQISQNQFHSRFLK